MSSKFDIVKSVTGNIVPVNEQQSQDDGDKGFDDAARGEQSDSEDSTSQDAQAGVQGVEAMTSVWSRSHLITAYVMYTFSYTYQLCQF